MHPKPFWRDMATTDYVDCSDWIVVLPVAAIEQHGPHLPVGVDSIIAEGMIDRAAKDMPADLPVTFLPVQQIGKSNEHVRFAGTLTLDAQTAIAAWQAIGESIARARVRKLVLVTSHGGNVAPMDIVARDLRERHDMLVITTSWGRLGDWQSVFNVGPETIDIHGGFSETSVMLALRPDLVDMTKAQNFSSAQTGLKQRFKHLAFHSGNANIAWLSGDLNPQGVVGDASQATAALGELDLAGSIRGFIELMREINAFSPPKAQI